MSELLNITQLLWFNMMIGLQPDAEQTLIIQNYLNSLLLLMYNFIKIDHLIN